MVMTGPAGAVDRLPGGGAQHVGFTGIDHRLLHPGHARERLSDGPSPQEVTEAFWCVCHGGRLPIARMLLRRGADQDWRGFDDLTPLGAAQRSGGGGRRELADRDRRHDVTDVAGCLR